MFAARFIAATARERLDKPSYDRLHLGRPAPHFDDLVLRRNDLQVARSPQLAAPVTSKPGLSPASRGGAHRVSFGLCDFGG